MFRPYLGALVPPDVLRSEQMGLLQHILCLLQSGESIRSIVIGEESDKARGKTGENMSIKIG